MAIPGNLVNPPAYTPAFVRLMCIKRWLQTGFLLHLITLLAVGVTAFFTADFLENWSGYSIAQRAGKGAMMVWAFSLIFFAQLDARSRHQNYKLIKDKLHHYGFNSRLVRPLAYSRCQRDAIIVAARDLGMLRQIDGVFYSMGFRWYHILPGHVVKNPLILLSRDYWKITLFTAPYHSKYFAW